jgi:hypothetical protein
LIEYPEKYIIKQTTEEVRFGAGRNATKAIHETLPAVMSLDFQWFSGQGKKAARQSL